jgi:hypothetical protein
LLVGVRVVGLVARGGVAFEVGWKDNDLVAFASVGTGDADVGDPGLIMVVDEADERAGGDLDGDRALGCI